MPLPLIPIIVAVVRLAAPVVINTVVKQVIKQAPKVAKEVAKQAPKAAKEAVKAAPKKAASGPKKGNTPLNKYKDKAKNKPKLKCGEGGKYGDLKKKTGKGKLDRDHIPSKAALQEKAKQLNGGVDLKDSQIKKINDWGNSIAIPRQAHQKISPTYGGRNDPAGDAKDLANSAKRDVNEMLENIDEYDADEKCKKAYKKASEPILKMTNTDYERELRKLLRQY